MISARTELLPHENPPLKKLMSTRVAGLFMDMGTGKTRTAIEFVLRRQARIRHVVWFCPVSLKATIAHEIRKHTDSDAYVFSPDTRPGNIPEAFWFVAGIESIAGSDRVYLAARDLMTPDTAVIVDESSYIKGHRAKRTLRITDMAAGCRYRMILTGTPISQGVVDLFAQMRFLSPKILGYHSFYSFAANHLEYSDKYPGMIVRSHNTAWLAAKIQPYVYQVTKAEAGLNLPAKLFESRYFTMTLEQREAYEEAKYNRLMLCPPDELDGYAIFQLFTDLQKIVSGYTVGNDGSVVELPHARLDLLAGVVEDIPVTSKIIIWCKYRFSVAKIAALLGDVALFHGGLSEPERERQLQAFRRNKRFLVATLQSGGHGLTLNEADYAVFYENGFKYAGRKQAEDRNHRIGQVRPVTYVDLVCNKTIDVRIQNALYAKGCAVDDFRQEVDALKKLKGKALRDAVLKKI